MLENHSTRTPHDQTITKAAALYSRSRTTSDDDDDGTDEPARRADGRSRLQKQQQQWWWCWPSRPLQRNLPLLCNREKRLEKRRKAQNRGSSSNWKQQQQQVSARVKQKVKEKESCRRPKFLQQSDHSHFLLFCSVCCVCVFSTLQLISWLPSSSPSFCTVCPPVQDLFKLSSLFRSHVLLLLHDQQAAAAAALAAKLKAQSIKGKAEAKVKLLLLLLLLLEQ